MTDKRRWAVTALLASSLLFAFKNAAAEVEVLWLGHATTRITSVAGKTVLIDPFIKQNPNTPERFRDLKSLGRIDLILVTHGHGDHVRDLAELASMSGAPVVANFEYAMQLAALGVVDAKQVVGMNKGGTVTPLGPDIKVHMVPAEHSSSIDLKAFGMWGGDSAVARYLQGGAPVGYVVELENGFSIYHSGDTHVFGDMQLINEFHEPDLALVCIGGHYTMDPKGAAFAVRQYLKPKAVAPIHFGTYPVINRTPEEFRAALGDTDVELLVLEPGVAKKF